MLTTFLIVVAALVIGVLLVAATRPADLRVSCTATLAAPPSRVFPLLCLFMNMDKAIGGRFEQGLAKLDTVSLAGASVAQV